MNEEPKYLTHSGQILEASLLYVVNHHFGEDPVAAQLEFLERIVNADRCAESAHPNEELVRRHILLVHQFVSIESLPFLTEEMKEQLIHLKSELFESWQNLLTSHPEMTKFNPREKLSDYEKANSLMLTFLEWMTDIDFLVASEAEKKLYLSEFPFNK